MGLSRERLRRERHCPQPAAVKRKNVRKENFIQVARSFGKSEVV